MNPFDNAAGRYDSTFHVETVCFERIFDAPARTGSFSFEAAGKRHYGVILHGGDVPREGARYAVALAEPGNWQTIRAWRDLSTSDVHLHETVWMVVMEYAWLVYFVFPLLLGMALFGLGGWAALAVLAASVWAGAAWLRRVVRRNRAMARALLAV